MADERVIAAGPQNILRYLRDAADGKAIGVPFAPETFSLDRAQFDDSLARLVAWKYVVSSPAGVSITDNGRAYIDSVDGRSNSLPSAMTQPFAKTGFGRVAGAILAVVSLLLLMYHAFGWRVV